MPDLTREELEVLAAAGYMGDPAEIITTALHLYKDNERLTLERDDYRDAAQADRDAIGEYVLENERLREALEQRCAECRLGHGGDFGLDSCVLCPRDQSGDCQARIALQGGAE